MRRFALWPLHGEYTHGKLEERSRLERRKISLTNEENVIHYEREWKGL
jgi:hypothetical protein